MAIIDKPSDYFNTILYTGNGSSGHAQTGVGFQPNWVWLKSRTNSEYHNFYDSVRGVTKRLSTQPAGAAQTTISGLTAFGTDGFTVGAADTANQNSQSFVAWNWKEETEIFDIVSYTGNGSNRTISHNLSAVPQMIIVKRYNDGTASWMVYHQKIGNTKYLSLDTTAAEDTLAAWNNTTPTSSVFSVGTDQRVNANGASYIAYVFGEKQTYSKFGSYVGNGNADGTFVYTGFRPAWVMSKSNTNTEQWIIKDVARDPFNPVEKNLSASSASSEAGWGTAYDIDILSNGFKMRDGSGQTNGSGYGFIYMAFAENPFVTSTGNGSIPATAR